eukprot:CAMPEP_0206511468 /NCGR_PEP_ID=MMETSP0324_2-20121206/60307_1 /ASSEMBLY_ACC=CAM_ASM_000836 /TAXON_ID=2866 /ORGANISM="Crypthecodinium cohnii, Strain Seligo" /LENGTH=63 /DNA_ID=CAMNT_0054003251 /DNA_START=522 /DNA_END=710 /DNA_ORIENTATION=+
MPISSASGSEGPAESLGPQGGRRPRAIAGAVLLGAFASSAAAAAASSSSPAPPDAACVAPALR